MARVAKQQYAVSGLIVAAYHAGVQSAPFKTPAYPTDEHRAQVKKRDAAGLLDAGAALRAGQSGNP